MPNATQQTGDLHAADALGTELVRTMKLLAKAKARLSRLTPGRVEHAAFPIIATLVNQGPQRTSTLADTLLSDVSTISRQTSALVDQGLIERQADPADGRASVLAPTQDAVQLYRRARAERNAWLAGSLAHWHDDDTAQLIELLGRFNTDLAANIDAELTTNEGQDA